MNTCYKAHPRGDIDICEDTMQECNPKKCKGDIMKTFGTYEEVYAMMPCKKRPVIVHCKQIDEPFRVNSLEGDYKQGKKGDYLIKGVDGENYICDKEIFERTYDIL